MTKFWNVTVQLHDDRPQDAMTFVFADERRAKAIMNQYSRLFPMYFSLEVKPCDAWGRVWPQQYVFCSVCGQPEMEPELCSHARKTDHWFASMDGGSRT
jgi:hypothetical protein